MFPQAMVPFWKHTNKKSILIYHYATTSSTYYYSSAYIFHYISHRSTILGVLLSLIRPVCIYFQFFSLQSETGSNSLLLQITAATLRKQANSKRSVLYSLSQTHKFYLFWLVFLPEVSWHPGNPDFQIRLMRQTGYRSLPV